MANSLPPDFESYTPEQQERMRKYAEEIETKAKSAHAQRIVMQRGSATYQSLNNPLVTRNLKDELGSAYKQFRKESQSGASFLANWVGAKHPRIKRGIDATESGIQSIIDRTTPNVDKVKGIAQARYASTNSWIVTKVDEAAPRVLKSLGNLTDKAKPVAKSLSHKAKLAQSYTYGIMDSGYNKAMPKVVAGRNRASLQISSAANNIIERYPRLGPVAEGAREGVSVLTDLLTPGAKWVRNETGAQISWATAWIDAKYRKIGSLTQEEILEHSRSFAGRLESSAAETAYRFNQMGKVSRWGIAGLGVLAIGAMLWGTAKSRTGPDANLPPNYIPGQQAQKKIIPVPWGSPYKGPADDEAVAFNNNLHRLAAFAAPFAVVEGITHLPRRWREQAYLFARLAEEATPFSIGRIFGISSKISSSLAPSTISVAIKASGPGSLSLLGGANRLTPYGETFARAMSMSQEGFKNVLATRLASGETSLFFDQPISHSIFGYKVSGDQSGYWRQLRGTDTRVRFYESQGRWGQTFGEFGANEVSVTPLIKGGAVNLRLQRMLGMVPDREASAFSGGIYSLHKKALRFLHDRVPLAREVLTRIASIPTYNKNPIGKLRLDSISDIWVPGYVGGRGLFTDFLHRDTLKGKGRLAHAVLFDFSRSPWHLMRQFGASLGINVGPATTIPRVVGKLAKYGLMASAAITAFQYANETVHGALTAPLWNVYERARLLQARISDRLGFTETRKQHPKVFPWSAGALVFTPLLALKLAKGFHRATFENVRNIYGEGGLASRLLGGQQISPTISREARGLELAAHQASRIGRAEKVLARFGKVGLIGVAIAMAPFIFGTKYSEQEYADIFSGKKDIPVHKGRFWEFGSTPYEGGRIAYFRQHQAARRKIDAQYEVPGGGRTSIFKSLFDPYWRERESYKDRPYPITSAPFEEVPFVGPLLARTIGRFFKPPKLMHTAEWQAGQAYEPFGSDVAPNLELGGLRAPTPGDPLGIKAQIRETIYRGGEFMGLRGFIFQSTIFQEAFGGQAPYAKAHNLQPSRLKSFTDKWYESELGGMAGTNELFRRLFPRPQRGIEVNPLANTMPNWMPGSDYFVNFKEGDPYNKVPYGEERLPGKGFEERYPQLKGLRPDQYPSWARFEILADVAPWSTQTRVHRSLAYKEFGEDPKLRAHLEEIDWQMEQVKRKKDFSNYDFNRDMETVGGRVSEVLPTGEFRIEQYPRHLFKPAGLRFGVAASSSMIRNANGMTKEKADERAFEQRDEAQQFMVDNMLGRNVKLRIQTGGLNAPEVEARIFADGMNINRELAQRNLAAPEGDGAPTAGFLKKGYGKLIEAIGHMPSKVPGPFFLFTKLFNEASAVEEYKRSELYGSSSKQWSKPWQDFLRPYITQTVAKLTPGEFEPGHTKKKREMDMVFDRLEYMKQVQMGKTGSRTAIGMDPTGNMQAATSAMPYRERPYFTEFMKETDPGKRSQILSMVSADMQRALTGQWTRQYAEATGEQLPQSNSRANMQATMAQAQDEIQKAGLRVPPKEWAGWNPGVEIEDVKAIFLRNEGFDTHDFNIWDDRVTSLNRKPYLRGSAEYLTSRPLFRSTAILSAGRDRSSSRLSLTSEHTSRSLTGHVTHYNTVDRKAQDEQAYLEATDSLLVD